MNVLENIRLRRIKYDVKGSKQVIEYSIHSNILGLYEEALKKYGHELSVWTSAISFAEQCDYTAKIESFMKRLLESHPKNINAWQLAIAYEKKHKAPTEIRTLILKALQMNPTSEELYREAFRFELKSIGEEENKYIRAEIVFKSAFRNIDNIEFLCDLIDIADTFDESDELSTNLINVLREKFEKSELFWHSLAVRELCGRHYSQKKEKNNFSQMDRYLNARDMYLKGLEYVKTPLMYEYYLDIMINSPECDDLQMKYNFLRDTYEISRKTHENLLLPRHYLKLIDLTEESISEKKEILKFATLQYPMNASLWTQLLCIEIQMKSDIEKTFRSAVESLGENALPLWQIIMKYYQDQKNCTEEIENLYLQGVISQHDNISEAMIIDYIKWAHQTNGIKYARTVFQTVIINKLPFPELITTMVKFECLRERGPNVKRIENLFEMGVNAYGDRDLSVWLNFCKFQLIHKPLAISRILEQVRNKLRADLYQDFVKQFEIVKQKQLETDDFNF